ncbi:hypothetical protein GH714_014402 [Hevea brasiliensis]|uniref:Macro domain-containing protein n=1 Tax=Hevea brasiliensis TaxID=3981 RepID=A0A6A6MZN1_HEVBR|nr:hypothetical protein GH714_014402 [Hevea brasiliensis]
MAQMESSAGVSTAPSFDNGGDNTTVFPLSSSTVLKINKGDISKWFVDGSSDAIVNPANEKMLGGGGADRAIHRAAGPELLDACYKVPEVQPGVRCPTGEARITPGFKLPASHVIHTVGPIYETDRNAASSLKNAYRNSFTVAKDNNIKYIAFPAISCGVYGYPYEEAASVAISTVKEFADDLKEVNPTNIFMLPGGISVDTVYCFCLDPAFDKIVYILLAIHKAAGTQLGIACNDIPEVNLEGFKLPASCVIHTVGPVYYFERNPVASLRNAYRNSLMVAKANNIEYIAFPAISCGNNLYPLKKAATVAISTVKEFANDFKEVHFVLFLDDVYKDWLDKTRELLLH